jgi:hypothetical protein
VRGVRGELRLARNRSSQPGVDLAVEMVPMWPIRPAVIS